MKHDLETYVRIDGELRRVHIEIDVDNLARILGRRALKAKGKLATVLYKSINVCVVP